MLYRIRLTNPDHSETRKRADAAALRVHQLARKAIEEAGGLDTKWGRDAMDTVESLSLEKGGHAVLTPGPGARVLFLTVSKY